jgi:hypothetical protein
VSHIVEIKTQIKDREAIAAACRRLAIPAPTQGTARIFIGNQTGTLVRLKGWSFPIVINTTTGDIKYDNYEGGWGDIKELNAFRQAYTVEKARIEARRQGASVKETTRADGSIELEITTR